MAIEDAVFLARTLRDLPSIPEAFAAFERLRRERVEKIVAWGARGSSSKVPGAFGRVARDLMVRLIFPLLITEKSLAWMYDYRIGWDELTGEDGRHRGPRAGPVRERAQR
jgi:2-polyprenyl-6-methoxyphenol hydroxylase-like FAD-dependent oxidoreductase